MRNLNGDRDVLDAVRLSNRLVKAFLDRVPPQYRAEIPGLEEADGSMVPDEELWHPDKNLLPPPMNEKAKEEALRQLSDTREAGTQARGVEAT